ncbi:putative nuclease HARBI1 [Phlebotomus papatasi]|uniref:putative nuclease HARBI1 n=1 Tax=Phlebotomus papatasi TaxID=29031 RepID=UPI0024836773|nr:putative nuclease HARBI1 [Phlebotomus papatasi]
MVLRFLAIGDYQRPVGEDLLLGVCQSGVSNILEELLPILARRLGSKYIKWPTTREERQVYLDLTDGTQIGITSPTQEHLYLNRKGFHSINASLICDHEQKFIYVDARHPGATHDAAIWALSEERKFLFNINRTQHERCLILGDSGYPLEPWLITPYRNARTDEQIRFNSNFSKIRTIIENSIGVLKNRWRVLLTSERTLRYRPIKMARIINCCVALHNFCKLENIPDIEGDFVISYDEEDDIFQEYGQSALREEGEYNRELLKRYIM